MQPERQGEAKLESDGQGEGQGPGDLHADRGRAEHRVEEGDAEAEAVTRAGRRSWAGGAWPARWRATSGVQRRAVPAVPCPSPTTSPELRGAPRSRPFAARLGQLAARRPVPRPRSRRSERPPLRAPFVFAAQLARQHAGQGHRCGNLADRRWHGMSRIEVLAVLETFMGAARFGGPLPCSHQARNMRNRDEHDSLPPGSPDRIMRA